MSTNLDQAIDLLTKTDAYELPFASNIIELLGRDAATNGFMSAGAFSEACRNNPISTLLKALQYAVAQFSPSGWSLSTTTAGTLDLKNDQDNAVFSAPRLAATGGDIDFSGCGALTSLSFPVLATVFGVNFTTAASTGLVTIDVHSLVEIGSLGGATFSTGGCTKLTTILCNAFVPFEGTFFNCAGCALTAATVELILRRFVLAGGAACTIILNGGTNAGTASLSAQGQADVITLAGQLTINP